ncbi:MAG: AzlC family ABC transporter permease, partial [Coprobacillus cateniformis]
MYKRVIREAFLSSIPVMMGYIVLGIAFGMLLENKGYGVVYALLMSVFIYAGSMQFVAINLLTSGASLISAAIMTLLINARHMVYGLSMIKKFDDMGKFKLYMIFSLTDETYSLLVG